MPDARRSRSLNQAHLDTSTTAMKIPTPLEILRERVVEAIRTGSAVPTNTFGSLADTLRSEVETAGWQIDDRSKPGSWSFGIPTRRAEPSVAEAAPADAAVATPIWILAYSSASTEHTDGTLRVSYVDGKCYLHELRNREWHFSWLNDNAVALLHQVVLTRYRARVMDRPDAWTGSLRRMGTVVIDHRQVTIDGHVAARSTCGLTASGPWYSLDLSVSVDGFRVIEHWSLVHPDMEAHRLENDEVPIEVRCVALAGVALV